MVETATDRLMGGRLALEQPVAGHRAGTDAILLAASVPDGVAGVLADVGAGVGTAGLAAHLFAPALDLALIEREPELAVLAERNLLANGAKGAVFQADILDPKSRRAAGLADGMAGLVISNPPFFAAGQGRASPDDLRARAHRFQADEGLESWIRACVAIGAAQAEIILIHRADCLPALLAALAGRTGGVRVIPILPHAGEEASRVLVRAKKGSRAPFRLQPPLVLHGSDGRFTAEAQAIHRGELRITW